MSKILKSFRMEASVADCFDLLVARFGGSFSQHANAALTDYARRLLGGETVQTVAIVRKVVLERANPDNGSVRGDVAHKKSFQWTRRRKHTLLESLHAGLFQREELISRFNLSEEQLREWESQSETALEKRPGVN